MTSIETIRAAAEQRLRELQPVIAELELLSRILAIVNERTPHGANKRRIIEVVRANPGIAAPQIAELTGVKRSVVSATVTRMKSNGELEALGKGVQVPDAAGGGRAPGLSAATTA